MGADYDVTVRSTLGETSKFIVRILPCTHTGLMAVLLNNRTKILLLYNFIIESVKYCCNKNDLHDIFTNTSTSVNTNIIGYRYVGNCVFWRLEKIFIL